eukprot:scaffold36118_cov61-Phaeocystis_antarctica.AAC.3
MTHDPRSCACHPSRTARLALRARQHTEENIFNILRYTLYSVLTPEDDPGRPRSSPRSTASSLASAASSAASEVERAASAFVRAETACVYSAEARSSSVRGACSAVAFSRASTLRCFRVASSISSATHRSMAG